MGGFDYSLPDRTDCATSDFGNLGGDGKPSGSLQQAIARQYGSFDRWEQEFRATSNALARISHQLPSRNGRDAAETRRATEGAAGVLDSTSAQREPDRAKPQEKADD